MLKNSLLTLFALGVAFSCDRPQASASLHDVVTKPVSVTPVAKGLFHADSLLSFDFERLAKTFGEENIVEKINVSSAERNTFHVVVLFPDSPKQVEIVLLDSTKHAQVKAVIIGAESTWTTRAGVAPGMRLRDLQALNGKPFLFHGGGWDEGGYVTNWKEGALQGKISSCRLDRNYIMPYDLSKGDYNAHEFSSDSRDAQNGNPVIEEITLSAF